MDLAGKRALVVGGGQGIGRAAALVLAEAAADLAVIDAEGERAAGVADEVRALGRRASALTANVTDAEQAAAAVAESRKELGGLDIVVNIVGSAAWAPLLAIDEAAWDREFDINLKHHWYVARSAAQGWIEAGEPGVLCVVGSVSGLFSAANHGAYGAAKAGLLGLVKTAAEEWWPHQIRINAVVPGAVRTPRIEAAWEAGNVPRPDADTLDRMALPEDIAHAIGFLVSDQARRITGQSLIVDGGSTTKFPYAVG